MSYSITIPNTPEAIRAAAAFFAELLHPGGVVAGEKPVILHAGDTVGLHLGGNNVEDVEVPDSELNPSALFNDSPVLIPPSPPMPPTPPTPSVPPMPSVKLADGIPWDERIHAGSRAILAAAPNGWKRRPKPPEYATKEEWLAVVEKVEAELRTAMGVLPLSMEAGGSGPDLLRRDGLLIPPSPPATTGLGWTYASLTEAITRNGFGPETVTGVLARIGLTAYPQLSARPDLIPQVAEFLGLGSGPL